MNRIRCHAIGLLLAVVCVGSVQPLFAQGDGDVKLRLKAFEPDAKPFYQVLEYRHSQAMKLCGQKEETSQEVTQILVVRCTPQPRKGENLVVKQQIVDMKATITIGTTKITYDSSEEFQKLNPTSATTNLFKAIKEVELTLVIDPAKLAIAEVQGSKESVAKLSEQHPQMKNIIKGLLGEDAVRQIFERTWAVLPTGSVQKGATWNRSAVDMDLIERLAKNTASEYTFEGLENDRDVITMRSRSRTTPKNPPDGLWGPRRVSDLNGQGSGKILFDRARGRIESSTMQMKTSGLLVIEIGGTETNVELRQTEEIRMTAQDTMPVLSGRK